MTKNSALRYSLLSEGAQGYLGSPLTTAEKRLLGAVCEGTIARYAPFVPVQNKTCFSSKRDWEARNYPPNGAQEPDPWSSDRDIRAELINRICADVALSTKVHPHGIRVYGANIIGPIDLSFMTITFPLHLACCRINDAFDLRSATLPELCLTGSVISSLNGEVANVKGDLLLDYGFLANKQVLLRGAKVEGGLWCEGGSFKAAGHGDTALDLQNAKVSGDVLLRCGFNAENVEMGGIEIEGSLDCTDAQFHSLALERATIKQDFIYVKIKRGVKRSADCELDLTDASVGSLVDDKASWPNSLKVDGFVYARILSGPTSAEERLAWLARQSAFSRQPYRQLAKVLRDMGDEHGAKNILFELEQQARAEDRNRVIRTPSRMLHFARDIVSDATVGYGIYPGRAVWWLGGLTAIGWILHRRAQRAGNIMPSDKDAYEELRTNNRLPEYYPPFSPIVYSIDTSLPIIGFGQKDRWHPRLMEKPPALQAVPARLAMALARKALVETLL